MSNNSQRNRIGTAGFGNVISGNVQSGVVLAGAQTKDNELVGNLIGTNVSGTIKKGNEGDGVRLDLACENTIGGVNNESEPNVISGNGGNGIKIVGGNNNLVAANRIGTNLLGTAELGNEENGIYIDGTDNKIGVEAPGEMEPEQPRNIISGNAKAGIEIDGGSRTRVVNCYIGTDVTGMNAVANVQYGVRINSDDNTIGGATEWTRNVISGNGTVTPGGMFNHGVFIESGTRNYLQSNYIGTKANGTAALPNGGDGVYIRKDAPGNVIGGVAGRDNVISGNSGYGVYIESNDNIVTHNKIGKDPNGAVLANGNDWLWVIPTATGNVTDPNDHN